MSLKIVVHGPRLDLAEELEEEYRSQALHAVGLAADVLLSEVQHRLSARQGSKKSAAPSGESPEEDTGELLRSFKKVRPRVKGAIASSGIRSDDPGGNRVEFGYTDVRGIRTFPHPYLRPAVEAAEEPITRIFDEAFP